MKKIITVSLLLVMATPVLAVYSTSTPQGNGDPNAVISVWGGTNLTIPHVAQGQTVTDDHGVSDKCPVFVYPYCVNISHTAYYVNQMVTIAKHLVTQGVENQFSVFSGWVSAVK